MQQDQNANYTPNKTLRLHNAPTLSLKYILKIIALCIILLHYRNPNLPSPNPIISFQIKEGSSCPEGFELLTLFEWERTWIPNNLFPTIFSNVGLVSGSGLKNVRIEIPV